MAQDDRSKLDSRLTAALSAALPQGEAPKSILLIPAGKFSFRDDREDCINSNPEAVIAASAALKMEVGLPIDYDHATDFGAPNGLPAPASGWIKALRIVDGAIWGDVEWTAAGAAAIAAGEWRYSSAVFDFDKKTRIVTRVMRAALTNNPALYDTAIAAKEAKMAEKEKDEKTMSADDFREKMASKFGCEKGASHEAICEAAGKAKMKTAKAAEDDEGDDEKAAARLVASGKVVPQKEHAELITRINKLESDRRRDAASVKVNAAIREGRITAAQREWATTYCAADEKSFDEFLAKQPVLHLGEDGRFEERNPGDGKTVVLTKDQQAICTAYNIKPEDFIKDREALSRQTGTMQPNHSDDRR